LEGHWCSNGDVEMMSSLLFAFGGVVLVFTILGYIAWVANSLPPEPKDKK